MTSAPLIWVLLNAPTTVCGLPTRPQLPPLRYTLLLQITTAQVKVHTAGYWALLLDLWVQVSMWRFGDRLASHVRVKFSNVVTSAFIYVLAGNRNTMGAPNRTKFTMGWGSCVHRPLSCRLRIPIGRVLHDLALSSEKCSWSKSLRYRQTQVGPNCLSSDVGNCRYNKIVLKKSNRNYS